jgi:ketosteroid isomerase-like protein
MGRFAMNVAALRSIRDHTVTFDSAEATDVVIRIFGDTAVVTGLAKFDIRVKERASSIQERFTDVYVKLNGRWQPVASHSTPIKAAK